MADALLRVQLTASFLERLEAIEALLNEADAAFAFDRLLAELRTTVVPNLRRFPRIGRRYLEQPPQSAEALAQLAALPAGAADRLREYLHGNYLILYPAATPRRRCTCCPLGSTANCPSSSLGYGLAQAVTLSADENGRPT